jgi:hypothetical protein
MKALQGRAFRPRLLLHRPSDLRGYGVPQRIEEAGR